MIRALVAAVFGIGGFVDAHSADVGGFVETALSVRTTDRAERAGDYVLREVRAEVDLRAARDDSEVFARVDVVHDAFGDETTDLELREAWGKFSAFGDRLDVKLGRQIMTWGTGDLLFVNDLFPKDWVSFFTGRDDAYLKAPVDGVRLGVFGLPVDLDVAWIPEFTADTLPTGTRLHVAGDALPVEGRPLAVDESVVAARASGYWDTVGWSVYGSLGRWPTPAGSDEVVVDGDSSRVATHPRLHVVGASLRGVWLSSVVSLEGGLYRSPDDADGDDPTVANSELRGLFGIQRSLTGDLTVGAQAYVESMLDFSAYEASASAGSPRRDRKRVVVTLRVEQLLRYQTVRLSTFVFGSPTDDDVYARIAASYRVNDDVTVAVGANVFAAENDASPFGRFDANDNIWVRGRVSF